MAYTNPLTEEYTQLYSKIRNLINDEQIYPSIDTEEFKKFVSKNWAGVPSFAITLREMKSSDKGHISLRIYPNYVQADLFFNGVRGVKRFINFLHPSSKKEFKEFVEAANNLSNSYTIELQQAEKWGNAPTIWGNPIEKIGCNNLTALELEDFIQKVKKRMEDRDERQKLLPKGRKITVSVAVGRTKLNKLNELKDEEIKPVFENLSKLIRITHYLKSDREIKRQIKREKKLTDFHNERDKLNNKGADLTEKEKNRLKKIEEKINELKEEQEHPTEHQRK